MKKRMRKKKTPFLDKVTDKAKALGSSIGLSIIGFLVTEIIKPYIHINEWLNKQNLVTWWVILIPIAIVVITLIALAFVLLFGKGIRIQLQTAMPPILFFCGTLLLINSLHIVSLQRQPGELIGGQKINMELLLEKNTIDIPVMDTYSGLILFIKIPEKVNYLPEFELEKTSPLKGDWDIIVPGDTTEKLAINDLEAAKENELYYRPKSGRFRVLDIEGREVSLSTENMIRMNFRNFAGFEETLELVFQGKKTQGEQK